MNPDAYERIEHPCDRVYEHKGGTTASDDLAEQEKVPLKIIWPIVILLTVLHLAALYGAYLMFTSSKWQTNIFAIFLIYFCVIGVSAGAHRLWTHRSYKAKLPLRILLAVMFIVSFQRDLYGWVRDHRVHHKYSDTDADPHNSKRGFFFSHVGWLMCQKHPEVLKKEKDIDLSDVMADPVVRFQSKYCYPLGLVSSFILPTVIPMYFWNETLLNALMVPTLLRYCFNLNQIFLVNSAAHKWGYKTYDANIESRDSILVGIGTVGEGFHNYHHTFPYDYAANEYGFKYNLPTTFIDVMAFLGQAYDLKTASKENIRSRKLRTGEDSLERKVYISKEE